VNVILVYTTRSSLSLGGIEPLGLMYLVAVLKRDGHRVLLTSETRIDRLSSLFADFKPDIAGFSVIKGYEDRFLLLCSQLKARHRFFCLWGGHLPTVTPEIVAHPAIDAVLMGEGEEAIVELCRRLQNDEDIDTCPNLALERDGKIQRNDLLPLIEDLDALPFPDREALYEGNPLARRSPVRATITRRGCYFSCHYCQQSYYKTLYGTPGKKGVRTRSPGNVVAELKRVKEQYGGQFNWFLDDVFVSDADWLEAFADQYRVEVGVPFVCQGWIEFIDQRCVSSLKRAGCKAVALGIECGDAEVRARLLGRHMTDERICDAFALLKAEEITAIAYIMCGFPGEGLKTDLKSLALARRAGADVVSASIFYPYPKMALTEEAVRQGVFDGNYATIKGLDWNNHSALRLPDKRAQENLRKLTNVVFALPWTEPLLPLAVHLPLGPLYRLLADVSGAYMYKTKVYDLHFPRREALGLLSHSLSQMVRLR